MTYLQISFCSNLKEDLKKGFKQTTNNKTRKENIIKNNTDGDANEKTTQPKDDSKALNATYKKNINYSSYKNISNR